LGFLLPLPLLGRRVVPPRKARSVGDLRLPLVFVNRWLPKGWRLPDSNSGIVAIGLAFVACGAANAIGGNGFVAVFIEAVAIRNLATSYEYSRHLSRVANSSNASRWC
jgi:NhaP-type Na+/H+ or K+/H+ antiporter